MIVLKKIFMWIFFVVVYSAAPILTFMPSLTWNVMYPIWINDIATIVFFVQLVATLFVLFIKGMVWAGLVDQVKNK